MKTYHKILLLVVTLAFSSVVHGQSKVAIDLVKEGTKLHDNEKYAEAIERYEAAIKVDPSYYNAYYELAFTLDTDGKSKQAIPYLEKALTLKPNAGEVYSMLGNVYDDDKQTDKAIGYYLKGIKVEPAHQRLYYNLAITYYRIGKYPEAETNVIQAIKLDSKHASSHRIYAMIANKQNQPGRALLAWCSFLVIEPNTTRAANALDDLKEIISKGIKKTDGKTVTASVAPDNVANLMIPLAVTNATAGRGNLSAIDSLTLQLTSLFSVAHTITMDKDQPFVANFFSNYFEKLGKSGNMPAFARYITLAANSRESKAWFEEHKKELTALDSWVTATKREF